MTDKKPIRHARDFQKQKEAGEPISVITAYDYTSARLVDQSPVDCVLVGDSLGMVMQGQPDTLRVSLEEMIYHCRLVRRGSSRTFIIGDMPFGSYQAGLDQALENGLRFMKESGVGALKLEGADEPILEVIRRLTAAGVPVMGHLGLTPQAVHTIGGYRVQGKNRKSEQELIQNARALEEAGCFAIVLELVVAEVAEEVTQALRIPTIGIGSGAACSGQVLVWHDVMGLEPEFSPRFVRRYFNGAEKIGEALEQFHVDIRRGSFPAEKESFPAE